MAVVVGYKATDFAYGYHTETLFSLTANRMLALAMNPAFPPIEFTTNDISSRTCFLVGPLSPLYPVYQREVIPYVALCISVGGQSSASRNGGRSCYSSCQSNEILAPRQT